MRAGMSKAVGTAAGLLVLSIGVAASAQAASIGSGPAAERRIQPYSAMLPSCESGEVLGFVKERFASREGAFWASPLQIEGFDRVRQTGLRSWGPSFVPRRFCTARAHLSDRKVRQVNYYVRETIGAFGNGWEVIWCVVGLDRHRTYAPGCEQATPWN